METLYHFSGAPLKRLWDVTTQEGGYLSLWKPNGLWVSDESDFGWSKWCKQESFGGWTYKNKINLNKDHGLLLIDSLKKMMRFNNHYQLSLDDTRLMAGINWPQLAEIYTGIVITPYLWECRLELDFMWYYGWDCASGCIWKPSVAVKDWESEKDDT